MPSVTIQRSLYRKSPLKEVVSQLYFPTILKIDTDIPGDFQDAIRATFPFYYKRPPDKQRSGTTITIGQDVPIYTSYHLFVSTDGLWKARLSQKILSLSTTAYGGWEDFRSRLSKPLEAFAKVYQPESFTHVCLRYRNVIRRESLNLSDVPWSHLLQPWIAGPVGQENLASGVEATINRAIIKIPSARDIYVDANYSLANEEPTKIKVFVLETHTYSNERTEHTNALNHLDRIHQHAGGFFRECITPRLHSALEPVDIPTG